MIRIVVMVAGLCAALPHQDPGHKGKIAWEVDPAAGLAKAKSKKMTALLYFTAEW